MPDDISISDQAHRTLRRWTLGIKVCIAFVIVPPLYGLVGTVADMVKAFQQVGPSAEKADPSVLAESVGEALMATTIGLVFSFFAFIFLIIMYIGRARAKRRVQSIEQGRM